MVFSAARYARENKRETRFSVALHCIVDNIDNYKQLSFYAEYAIMSLLNHVTKD